MDVGVIAAGMNGAVFLLGQIGMGLYLKAFNGFNIYRAVFDQGGRCDLATGNFIASAAR